VCVSLFYVVDTSSTGSRRKPGDCLSTLLPYSDTGCAYLPLARALLGAPVTIVTAQQRLGHGDLLFISAVHILKRFARREGDSGGHVLDNEIRRG
jgi:hypothetical protein